MNPLSLSRRVLAVCSLLVSAHLCPALVIVEGKAVKAVVVADGGTLTAAQQTALSETRQWLIDSIKDATGATLQAAEKAGNGPEIVLTTAGAQPAVAGRLALRLDNFDAFAIETAGDRLTLIGANVYALRHAVARVLRELGFRYYAPSAKWHFVPALADVRIDLNVAEVPDMGSRKIWYAYGQPDKELNADYKKWVMGNRLSSDSLINTGHSYGNIVLRNAAEFEKHPEYFALLESGERDNQRAIVARKFCYSNPGLMELAARDRIKLLAETRKANPLAYMVSMDPSDGQGTCHCEKCKALGTTTDRVVHLANHVAREMRKVHPEAWVGIYAYSSHRLPPTIAMEPNICVQVAMGFNQTEFSLPELVERWSKKASAIGLREYYGVEAWDWGLPGRMRGAKTDYHREWIPYYAARKAIGINAETNANWAAQMLGLHIAAELMWDTKADVNAVRERYLADCFGTAAPVMRDFQKKLEAGGPLQPALLSPLCADLEQAFSLPKDARAQARIVDLMAYLVYVDVYRKFETVAAAQPSRNDVYYQALEGLMNYAWRIRERDMVHYYALARRLCNGLPIQDKRLDFLYSRKDAPAVWMNGEAFTDDEIVRLFRGHAEALRADTTRLVAFSRTFQIVRPGGADAGPSRQTADPTAEGVAAFRKTLRGHLVGMDQQEFVLGVMPGLRPVTFTVLGSRDEVVVKETIAKTDAPAEVKFALPKAGEYRFTLEGEAVLHVRSGTPLMYEASPESPAWVDYSGPHYFYVPRGVKEIYVDTTTRLTMFAPGKSERIEVTAATRAPGQSHSVVKVPEGADGQIWHTDQNTRGPFFFLNIPPFLSLRREKLFVPREVAESDSLTTAR